MDGTYSGIDGAEVFVQSVVVEDDSSVLRITYLDDDAGMVTVIFEQSGTQPDLSDPKYCQPGET